MIKITTLIEDSLIENTSLKTEHGLSFLIESDNFSILFDTGQSDKFIQNAKKLNIDLSKVTHVVLSHSHYDHTGGFQPLVNTIGSSFKLYLGNGFFNKKFVFRNNNYKYIGCKFNKDFLNKNHINPIYTKQTITKLLPNINIITNFKRNCVFEKPNKNFVTYVNNKYLLDSFNDEIVITINTQKGLLVLLGCSHPGLVNILTTIIEETNMPIYGILGGTHLIEADINRINSTINYLNKLKIQKIGVSHCTGKKAMKEFQKHSQYFFHNYTGNVITL